jgi:DNA-binding transcriptional MerR regulator
VFIFILGKKMKIGEIAEATGVSRDTIRLYEKMGFLTGITRPSEWNNYKDYPEINVPKVKFIIFLKNLGISLKECQDIFDRIENEELDFLFQQEFIQNKVEKIEQQIKALESLKQLLLSFSQEKCRKIDDVYKLLSC